MVACLVGESSRVAAGEALRRLHFMHGFLVSWHAGRAGRGAAYSGGLVGINNTVSDCRSFGYSRWIMSYKEAQAAHRKAQAAYLKSDCQPNLLWLQRTNSVLRAFEQEVRRSTIGNGNYPTSK